MIKVLYEITEHSKTNLMVIKIIILDTVCAGSSVPPVCALRTQHIQQFW